MCVLAPKDNPAPNAGIAAVPLLVGAVFQPRGRDECRFAPNLGPTVSSLASFGFEFDLPPLDEQRRSPESLWAVERLEQSQMARQVLLMLSENGRA